MRVAILDDHQRVALGCGPWDRLDADVVAFADHVEDDDALVARLAGYDVVVAMRERTAFGRARLERLGDLRLLVTTGMANAAIDLDAARERGILVCGTGIPGHATAELTWGLILALARHVVREDAGVRAGGWQHSLGMDLQGATLGILGLGRLGTRVAAVGRAFGMDVVAWSQNLTPEAAAGSGATRLERDALLERADVVTIHLRLSERTRGLIGADALRRMRPEALLVNTSRGPIVDEAALVAALHAGEIGGAGLDVFDREPLPAGHPLLSAPRTVLTPHLGYVTRDTYRVFFGDAVEDIAAWERGEPVRVLNG